MTSRDRRPAMVLLALATAAITYLVAAGTANAAPRCFGKSATILGTNGNDVIVGTGGADVIVGLGGSDRLIGNNGNDLMCGGEGNDLLEGRSGRDRLDGGGGADNLRGAGGNDLLVGGGGNDKLFGGTGTRDVADYSDAGRRVTANLSTRRATGEGRDTFDDIEVLNGTRFGDTLTAGPSFEILNGGRGDDTLVARGSASGDHLNGDAGDDVLQGAGGDEKFDGGAGSDTGDYSEAPNRVDANLTTGQATGGAGVGTDTLVRVENLKGTPGDDELTGDANRNKLEGGDGTDIIDGQAEDDELLGGDGTDTLRGGADDDDLFGGAGNDSLEGGDGTDTLVGGEGDDALDGGAPSDPVFHDTADFSDATAPMEVDLVAGTASGQGNDTLTGLEEVAGSSFADVLLGDPGFNALRGQGGDDLLVGLGGGDILNGDDGQDGTDYSAAPSGVQVNAGGDVTGGVDEFLQSIEEITGSPFGDGLVRDGTAVLAGGAGNDFLQAGPASHLMGGDGIDTLFGGGTLEGGDGDDLLVAVAAPTAPTQDTLSGGPGDDELDANEGGDTLLGEDGDDLLTGGRGSGDDTLDGGPGKDVLNLLTAPAGIDAKLTEGTVTGAGIGSDTIAGIEDVIGSDFDDILDGDGQPNHLRGGFGNDTVVGGGGDDLLEGGSGNDLLFGNEGVDTVNGDQGDDELRGGPGADGMDGGDGFDLCDGAGEDVSRFRCEQDI